LALLAQAMGASKVAHNYLEQSLPIRVALKDRQGEAADLKVLGTVQRTWEDYQMSHQYLTQALEIFQALKLHAPEADAWLEMGLTYEVQNKLNEAEAAYDQARQIYQGLGNEAGVLEANGGLARCLLATDRAHEAKGPMRAGLAWLETHSLASINDPIHLYLTIYRVLRATNNTDEAKKALQVCQTLIQKRAEMIEETDLRASFLDNLPEQTEFAR
jgi:tetratricopeptide (TPR) repeat protein